MKRVDEVNGLLNMTKVVIDLKVLDKIDQKEYQFLVESLICTLMDATIDGKLINSLVGMK